ncbi:transcriptional regulator family: Fungal Specific TF [Trichoderma harzianum]|nr:transcriptional regulator family: Fungal Specific TF [Trichoderma harzianum]
MEEPLLGDSVRTSCERCRRRKIKCDRKRPCSKCAKAGTECVLQGIGEKQRPVSKSYVQALEGQIAALERVIQKLAVADDAERTQIISEISLTSSAPDAALAEGGQVDIKMDPSVAAARVKSGQLRRLRGGNAAQFFGGTSLLQIHFSQTSSSPVPTNAIGMESLAISTDGQPYDNSLNINANNNNNKLDLGDLYGDLDDFSPMSASFQYEPHHEISQKMMSRFFQEVYPYNMVLYREYFLRDYDVGSGKYYSDVLLYAVCALGALQYDDMLNVSEIFSGQAQALLYPTLDSPDLTTLQALVLLGYHEIAVGRASKGWLFCGMAFRLAHEMGLHLDPTNWDGSTSETSGGWDREIQRRVYWAVFTADKQLSLYFGRPPALYPGESDVRNTIRLQYPPGWQGLLETYICKGASANEWDNGVALVGSFIYRAELAKIIHLIITDLFENRKGGGGDPTIIATKTRRIHVLLTKWLAGIPSFLHWNQWTVGQVPPYVLHLHMMFHTIMIILHRPPSHMFENPGIAEGEDVEICYESLQAILRLMRSYSRYYRYRSLPLDFVHTLSTAASTVMMKRFLQKASWSDPDIERALSLIMQAMDEIQNTWPCVREIRDVLLQAQQTQTAMPPEDPLNVPDLMNGLQVNNDNFLENLGDDLGTLITDEFLSAQLPIVGPGLEPFDFNQMPGPGPS